MHSMVNYFNGYKPIMAMNIAKAVGRIGISKNLWNKKYAFYHYAHITNTVLCASNGQLVGMNLRVLCAATKQNWESTKLFPKWSYNYEILLRIFALFISLFLSFYFCLSFTGFRFELKQCIFMNDFLLKTYWRKIFRPMCKIWVIRYFLRVYW